MAAMDPVDPALAPAQRAGVVSLLTFDRLITGPIIHLVYWAGLAMIGIAAFGVVGASIGVAWREGGWAILAAIPVLAIGLLGVFAAALVWRAFCEFYVAVFRIGDDLAALRRASDEGVEPPLR
ncbi:MAG TPA: DUF4282 domain-containing protein [Caulobacteraceae bacterium]|jgi:hypothetical protein|nr:DUF4282 domain-containing protein [Caulobacteraceae bacterium]